MPCCEAARLCCHITPPWQGEGPAIARVIRGSRGPASNSLRMNLRAVFASRGVRTSRRPAACLPEDAARGDLADLVSAEARLPEYLLRVLAEVRCAPPWAHLSAGDRERDRHHLHGMPLPIDIWYLVEGALGAELRVRRDLLDRRGDSPDTSAFVQALGPVREVMRLEDLVDLPGSVRSGSAVRDRCSQYRGSPAQSGRSSASQNFFQ